MNVPRIGIVTTRRGDFGETSLGDRTRVPKDALRVQAVGTIDELMSVVGLALAFGLELRVTVALTRIQNELFDVGADLAMPPRSDEDQARRVDAGDVAGLEADQTELLSELEPLVNFVLPGGSPGAAALHVARTVCRRAEREAVHLARTEPCNPEVLRYLNRLSDLLFVMARSQNRVDRQREAVWTPRAGKRGAAGDPAPT
jgi:cob(I)alamin adenosyltransferase